jgi:hypothetical protein
MFLSRNWGLILVFLLFMDGLAISMPDDKFILASEVSAKIEAGQSDGFENCIIVGDLNLSALKIEGPVHFNYTIFRNSLDFGSTIFNGTAYFRSSVFNGHVGFRGTTFNGDADFRDSTFNSTANFRSSVFNGYVGFRGTTFNGYADFRSSNFNGYADFRSSNFNDYAGFRGTIFNGDADFGDSAFNDTAYFMFSAFKGTAYFMSSNFNGYADFGDLVFNDTAYFMSSAFNSTADFRSSTFNSTADFGSSNFNDTVNFNRTKFGGLVNLGNSKFYSDVFFIGTEINDLYADWELVDPSNEKLILSLNNYKKLKQKYLELGFSDDADDCEYELRKIKANNYDYGLYMMLDYIARCSYGYGLKPFFSLFWSLFIISLFSLIFWRSGTVELNESIYFSYSTFVSGTGKLFIDKPEIPKNSPVKIKILFDLERFLGLIFISLLLIALTKTIFANN